jgi:hypothetical protein
MRASSRYSLSSSFSLLSGVLSLSTKILSNSSIGVPNYTTARSMIVFPCPFWLFKFLDYLGIWRSEISFSLPQT